MTDQQRGEPEIRRDRLNSLADALTLPSAVRQAAIEIAKAAVDRGFARSHSGEATAAVSIYAAARQAEMPRCLDEVSDVSGVDRLTLERTYRDLVRETDIESRPPDPVQYIQHFADLLDLSTHGERSAVEVLETYLDGEASVGNDPVALAAGALYAGSLLDGDGYSQDEVSDATGISVRTISITYRELLSEF